MNRGQKITADYLNGLEGGIHNQRIRTGSGLLSSHMPAGGQIVTNSARSRIHHKALKCLGYYIASYGACLAHSAYPITLGVSGVDITLFDNGDPCLSFGDPADSSANGKPFIVTQLPHDAMVAHDVIYSGLAYCMVVAGSETGGSDLNCGMDYDAWAANPGVLLINSDGAASILWEGDYEARTDPHSALILFGQGGGSGGGGTTTVTVDPRWVRFTEPS